MKYLLALVLAASAIALGDPAEAGRPAGERGFCVTGSEYARVQIGMKRLDVQEILDARGVIGPGTDAEVIIRQYPMCARKWNRGRVTVMYNRRSDRVTMLLWSVVTHGTLMRR